VDPAMVMVERHGHNSSDGQEDGAVPECGDDDGGGGRGCGIVGLTAEEERHGAVWCSGVGVEAYTKDVEE
jgi:hypothetical protein